MVRAALEYALHQSLIDESQTAIHEKDFAGNVRRSSQLKAGWIALAGPIIWQCVTYLS